MSRHAHLVGSVGLENAETVFTTVSEILGSSCSRIPDGETGDRGYWIRWQKKSFDRCDGLELKMLVQKIPGFKDALERPFFKIKDGVDKDDIDLGDLGYANEAIESYKVFASLVEAGKISADTRFQVSLPTPIALVCGFIVDEDQQAVEPAIEKAMMGELARLQTAIPADRLTIQWDVCFEVVGADGGPKLPYDDHVVGSAKRIARLSEEISADVEVGIHLCYGDPGHKHIVEPKDLGTSIAFANAICQAVSRSVQYVHMPVPRERNDTDYFAPLEVLNLPTDTRLVLGLVHHTDGLAGSKTRIAAAENYVQEFDIGTECGLGRRDPMTIPDLLRLHKDLCS